MMNPKIEAIAREQIRIEFDEREGPLSREIGTTLGEFSKRGVSQSSMAARAIGEVFENELKIRAGLALNILRRVSAEVGVQADPDLAPSMKAVLGGVIEEEAAKLSERMLKTPPIGTSNKSGTAGASFGVDVQSPFQRVHANVLSKIHTEVDLLDARLTAISQQAQVKGNQVAVVGTGNVVQTGSFVGSPMTMTIDAGAKAQIDRTLVLVEDALAKLTEPASINVTEVREMVAQSRAELAKPKPNSTMLGSLLAGVATTIQTVASLRPAYDAIKGALAMLGIALP